MSTSNKKNKYWFKQEGWRVYHIAWQGWLWFGCVLVGFVTVVLIGLFLGAFESDLLGFILIFCAFLVSILPVVGKVKSDPSMPDL